MNNIKQFTVYNEMFRLIDTLKPKENRDKFLGELFDFYFKDEKPKFNLNSYEETVWLNISKPIISYKSKALNGAKGGRPKKTETKTEIESKSNSESKTTSDVYVYVNNSVEDKGVIGGEETCYDYIEKQFGRTLTSVEYQKISLWQDMFSDEIIKYAIDRTILNNVKALSYTESIINAWHDKGYKTLEDCVSENKTKEEVPSWYGKDIEEDTANENDIKQLETMMSRKR